MHPHQRAKELFLACCELEPTERASFLARSCGEDRHLLAEVRAMLAVEEDEPEFLRGRAADAAPRMDVPLPRSIGPYRIRHKLGEGGMGAVYEAEQQHPRRTVALKVLRPFLLSAKALRRFELEGELLGRLEHPGIARIYESGRAESEHGSQPYFAMELVRGEPVTLFARERDLSPAQRLELVARIADAVQHAHEQGVIHRDLKPENVLVDATGQPKILDFGIARASESDVQLTTVHTDVGQILGTLAYMSPEQASGDPRAIDNRSDVYSLGVILYELLAGRLPYELAHQPLPEAVRIIREEEPRRLSAVCSVHRGDVETIVHTALAKDREQRYPSAGALAEDIRALASSRPIRARRPSKLYTLRKFVQRNRTIAGAIVCVLCALVAGLAVSVRFGLREAAQRRRAELSSYQANLRVTLASLAEGNYAAAREAHAQAPVPLRNWEWHHLDQRWVQELARVTIPAVVRAAFLDENRVLALDASGGMHLWNVLSGELSAGPHPGAVSGAWPAVARPLALSADGRWLLASVPGELLLGEPLSHGPPIVIPLPGRTPLADPGLSSLAPDGSRAALATESGEVILVARDGVVGTLPRDSAPVRSLVFHPAARLLAVRREGKLALWNTEPLELAWEEEASYGAVAFASDGTALVCENQSDTGAGSGLFSKDVRSGATLRTLSRQKYGAYHLRRSGELAFSADRRLLALTFSHAGIFLLDAQAGTERASTELEAAFRKSSNGVVGFAEYGPGGDVLVCFSPSGAALLSLGILDHSLRIWRTGIDGASRACRGHETPVRAVAFSPDGATLASGARSGNVRLWDAASDEPVATLPNEGPIGGLAFSAEGRHVACQAADGLVVWDLERGAVVAELEGEYTGAIAWSGDGSLLAAAMDGGRVRTWNARTLVEARVLACAQGAVVSALTCSGDGSRIATGSSQAEIGLWEASTGARLAGWKSEHEGNTASRGALSMAFAPDGKRLAVGWGDATVSLLDVPSLAVIREMSEPRGEVFAVAYSPDGTRIASGGGDGFLRLWDGVSGDPLLGLEEHSDSILALAFSPDGRRIATGSADRTVRIWDSEAATVRSNARAAYASRRLEAEPLVERLFGELATAEAVIARLQADDALGPDLRRVALRSVLQRELAAARPPDRIQAAR